MVPAAVVAHQEGPPGQSKQCWHLRGQHSSSPAANEKALAGETGLHGASSFGVTIQMVGAGVALEQWH